MRSTPGRRFAGQIAVSAAIILGGIAILAALQRQLLYFPQQVPEQQLLAEATRLGLQPWRNSGGELIGWHSADTSGANRMLVFHGNAGHALQRNYYTAGFGALRDGWQTWLFEYPGYGARGGSPSESAIKAAAGEAVRQLLQQDQRPLFLLGESLGSGVASYLAEEFPDDIQGVLLVTPFTRLEDVAAHHFSFLPVRTLLSERYDSLAALRAYQGPVAFLLAGNDEVVPTVLGRELYDSYGGRKWLLEVPGAGHNTLPLHPSASWWEEVSDFLDPAAPP